MVDFVCVLTALGSYSRYTVQQDAVMEKQEEIEQRIRDQVAALKGDVETDQFSGLRAGGSDNVVRLYQKDFDQEHIELQRQVFYE